MKFYVVEGLPENAVLGSASMAEMKARLDYAKKEFYFEGVDGKREESVVRWAIDKKRYWRHPLRLRADAMYKIKANTAMCVAVKQISNEQWKHWATREGAVTPSRGKERMQQEFLTGYGYGPFYPRVVLFNHNDYDIIVREHEFHPMPPAMARVYESGDEMARDVSTVFQKDLRQNVGEGAFWRSDL